MNKPLAKTQAGGATKGLSIVLEGVDNKLIAKLSIALANEISKSGHEVVLDNALRSPEENILVANQYLLDATAASLSPATISLMVVIKLRERQMTISSAKSRGLYAISNSSWLGDAYYYEVRSKSDISKQIISDCAFMKPDVWVVIDEEAGVYSTLAKQIGVKVLSPKLEESKLLNEILTYVSFSQKAALDRSQIDKNEEIPAATTNEIPSNKHQASYLAITRGFSGGAPQVLFTELRTDLAYYRPEKLGIKVLGAYDTILKKILQNYSHAVTDYSKYLATQAIRNKRPFIVKKLMAESRQLCRSLLPACILIDIEEVQEFEELSEPRSKLKSKISGLLPFIDSDPPKLQVSLIGHTPRNEFDVLEGIIFANLDQSTASIKRLINELTYEKKAKLLKDSLSQVTNLPDVAYDFDIFCELRELFDLVKDVGGNVIMQDLTPRNGYDIPEKIEKAGLADVYQQSFDLSLELYSLLQAAGFEFLAQYVVLLGHRMRCRLTLTYTQIKKLLTQNKDSGYKTLTEDIKQQVLGVHPLVWSVE